MPCHGSHSPQRLVAACPLPESSPKSHVCIFIPFVGLASQNNKYENMSFSEYELPAHIRFLKLIKLDIKKKKKSSTSSLEFPQNCSVSFSLCSKELRFIVALNTSNTTGVKLESEINLHEDWCYQNPGRPAKLLRRR